MGAFLRPRSTVRYAPFGTFVNDVPAEETTAAEGRAGSAWPRRPLSLPESVRFRFKFLKRTEGGEMRATIQFPNYKFRS